MPDPTYGLTKHLPQTSYDDAILAVTEQLKAEGFGVLTEIDVKKTLKAKLDVDFRRYVILGACKPPLAYRALSAEPFVGLLLPCNVIVFEEGAGSTVSIIHPGEMFRIVDNPGVLPIAEEVEAGLRTVLEKL